MALSHLFYGGNGTTLVDSGLPLVGVMYSIAPNGDLLWYQYQGNGESDRSARTGWHPNSGNQIGNGWGDFRALFGGFDDSRGRGHVIYAVKQDGDLLWYKYHGNGENDPLGSTGWHENSRNPIGNNW